MVKQIAETKVRGARAVEDLKQELAAELDQRGRELADLKNTYEQDRLAAADTHAKLSADLAKALGEVAHLTEKAQTRGTELQRAIDESFREVGQFYEIGASLEQAAEAFTRGIEAVESRLLVASKKMKELGLSVASPAAAVESPAPEAPQPPSPPVPQAQADVPVQPVRGRSKH
jgi:DNA repair exonuclease SbcCD ATPase subunit